MNNSIELKKARLQLYKPNATTFKLVAQLADSIMSRFENKNITFDKNSLKIDNLYVRMIEVNPNDIAYVMVHWYPDHNISNQTDPFCSAYILEEWEILKIINAVETL